MNFDQLGNDIIASLEKGITQNTLLEDLLIKEKLALEENEITTLKVLIDSKTNILNTIETLNVSRSELFKECGLAYNKIGLHQLSQHLSTPIFNTVVQLWGEMHDSLEHCQTLNNVNGRIINHSQKRNAKIMHLLRGSKNQTTYNQSGMTGYNDQLGSLIKV